MDLKSMLNGEVNNRPAPPPLYTPQPSSHERATSQTPNYEYKSGQPTPYARPTQTLDTRSPGSGGYFNIQSPHPSNSASTNTPSAGHHSTYTQSPGSYNQTHTPRDNLPSQYVPSPSPAGPQPPTPSQYHQQSGSLHQAGALSQTQSLHSPHNGPPIPHSHSYSQTRQISPQAQFHQPSVPVTPLGPPLSYSRSSPHVQRPPSQGHEHYRTSSLSSVASAHSRDYNQTQMQYHEQMHRDNIQRQHSMEEARYRERSIESVSPKTIPKPTPSRSISGHNSLDSRAAIHQYTQSPVAQPNLPPSMVKSEIHGETSELLNTMRSPHSNSEIHALPNDSYPRAVLASTPTHSVTPKSAHSQLPSQQSPSELPKNGLKRNASVMSTSSISAMPPRKRLRRDDIPMFARSARKKALRLQELSHTAPARPQPEPQPGNQAPPQTQPAGVLTHPVNGRAAVTESDEESEHWESAITNEIPYEDLTRRICDWIVRTIGMAAPPSGGAVFEIEAKIGAIEDISEGGRLRLPVETESIFAKDRYGRKTRFGSSMDMHQHKQLNEFLNGLVQQSMKEALVKKREVIHYSHPKENDDFFELTQEGLANLPPAVKEWMNPHRHKPRVRRTTDRVDGSLKAQIIKTRIADLEVYNPQCDFDYRISVSIESPWNGNIAWLTPVQEDGGVRDKDRMSYRHLAYQIDLTQVTTKTGLEHELEVEISTEQIRLELENLQAGRPSHYERLVLGFINNVRVLCRQGTIRR